MPEYRTPGIYVEEVAPRAQQVDAALTGTAGFVGIADGGPSLSEVLTSENDFQARFSVAMNAPLAQAAHGYFENGGRRLYIARATDAAAVPAALEALASIDEIDLVAAPGMDAAAALIAHVEAPGRYRLALIDPPAGLDVAGVTAFAAQFQCAHAALYWPWVLDATEAAVPPSGHVAGIIAQSGQLRGVWKAPANIGLAGVTGLQHAVTNREQDVVNPLGINCLRAVPGRGILVWGARTLSADFQWKYISVRRLNDWIEKSIRQGIQFATFEPNGPPLWSAVGQMIENFLFGQWKQGALVGTKPQEAYFVVSDRSVMTQNDLDNGRLVVMIGIAPLRPAEFLITRIEQVTTAAFQPPDP